MRIVLATSNQQDGVALRRIALGEGLECSADDLVTYHGLPARLAQGRADLVLIALGAADEAELQTITTAVQTSDAPVLAAGPADDATCAAAALRAGACAYLDIDQLRAELPEALSKIGVPQTARKAGTVVALFSPSGGVGVSSTAINLATRLARGHADQVALIDLKPAPSDLAVLLDIQPEHTVNEVLRNWQRLDRQLIAGAMIRHRSGAHLLVQESYPQRGGVPENCLAPQAIRQLLVLMRRSYQTTVLDLDHTLDASQVEAMRLATFVGLIVRPDVSGLRRARWALDTAEAHGLARDRFRLLLGRRGGRGQIGVGRIEQALGIELFHAIPEAGTAVGRAVNQGITVAEVSRLSRISRSFSSLARSVESFNQNL